MTLQILVIGELNPDLVLRDYSAFPAPGQEVLVNDLSLTLGSASAICANGLARLGNRVRFASKVGQDAWGDFCVRILDGAGIDTRFIRRDRTCKTGITVAITAAGDRALVTYLGAIATLTLSDIDARAMDDCTHLHISSYFLLDGLRSGIAALFRQARERGMTTSLDPGFDPSGRWDDGLIETLRDVDVFFPNQVELAKLAGSNDPVDCLRRLANGHTLVVGKLGADGCIALRKGRPVSVPAFSVRVVDTTGAGDSFNGGFLHAWLRRRSLEESLRYGAACGALATRAMGGIDGQATAAEAEDLIHHSIRKEVHT